MYKITHILWSRHAIGIAIARLKDEDTYKITVKNKKGDYLHPGVYRYNKEEYLERYGPITIINKKGLQGVFVPLMELWNWKIRDTEINA